MFLPTNLDFLPIGCYLYHLFTRWHHTLNCVESQVLLSPIKKKLTSDRDLSLFTKPVLHNSNLTDMYFNVTTSLWNLGWTVPLRGLSTNQSNSSTPLILLKWKILWFSVVYPTHELLLLLTRKTPFYSTYYIHPLWSSSSPSPSPCLFHDSFHHQHHVSQALIFFFCIFLVSAHTHGQWFPHPWIFPIYTSEISDWQRGASQHEGIKQRVVKWRS